MSGLASLTATYTDSEGEEDGVEDQNDKSPTDEASAHSQNSDVGIPTPPVPRPAIRVPSVATTTVHLGHGGLVSYHDDTIVSDDEANSAEVGVDAERRKSTNSEPEVEAVIDGIRLFPEPPGRCANELQEKINRLFEKMQGSGLDMNHVIQQRKEFRNPSIYEKLIQFCSINELGTNYPANVYDPLRWGKESYYEELAKVQNAVIDKLDKERQKEKTKVEFVSGTAKRPGSGSGADDEAKRRKSKWDQVGTVVGNSIVSGPQNVLKPAGLVQPSLTSSTTGTKGTVISAFGALRKPRI